MDIALIGTRGVPARYGGFETAIEEVGRRLADKGHQVTVFCRGGAKDLTEYRGMQLVHLPAVRHKVLETLTHTGLSVLHPKARGADVAVVFNAANAPFVPFLRAAKVPTAVHVDGLEWKRSKWGRAGRRYYLANERLACRWADALIADARGIQDYYAETHSAASVYIPYGAPLLAEPALHRLSELDLRTRSFHLVVARLEPENNVLEALQGYMMSAADQPLIVVGSAPYAEKYAATLQGLAGRDSRVHLIGAVWDQELLDALYAGCLTYIHGHSVGGTNPSLLRAMGAGAPVLAYDVVFNREVLGATGQFWTQPESIGPLLEAAEAYGPETRRRGLASQRRAADVYTWDSVASSYEALCLSLVSKVPRRR